MKEKKKAKMLISEISNEKSNCRLKKNLMTFQIPGMWQTL